MMKHENSATFLVLVQDPLVHMDISDLLSRGYRGCPVESIDSVEQLSAALSAINGRAIIVTSAAADDVISAIAQATVPSGVLAAVLISEAAQGVQSDMIALAVVPHPFKSDQLLRAVQTSLEHLLAPPS